jgi:hypothetical protein
VETTPSASASASELIVYVQIIIIIVILYFCDASWHENIFFQPDVRVEKNDKRVNNCKTEKLIKKVQMCRTYFFTFQK